MKKLFIATQLVVTLLAVTALPLFAADAPSVRPDQSFTSPLAEWTLASSFGWQGEPSAETRKFHAAIDTSRMVHRYMPQIGAIIIDPAHGGKDTGGIGVYEIDGTQTKLAEKDIALTVAKDLYALLKDKYPEKTIQLTRIGDHYISLEERAYLANTIPHADNEIVLYISLHLNASFNKSTSGFETWYLSPEYHSENNIGVKSMENMLLARSISDGLNAGIGSEMVSRGINTQNWYISRNTPGPTAVVELGFLTNSHDVLLLSEPEFIRKTALGLSNGISSFITLREK
ncbi:hypothetical protein AGMMS49991_02830 [Spirochaetia bacterium]|nr:hypothetical protein AGMMS49991_02830 [Spirochaetia bacterium]